MIRPFNLVVLVIAALIVLLASACTRKGTGGNASESETQTDGVQVGNGRVPPSSPNAPVSADLQYVSTKYRFTLLYSSELKLTEQSPESFFFASEEKDGEKASQGEFAVLPEAVPSGNPPFEELSRLAKAQYPEISFSREDVNGLVGILGNETKEGETRRVRYVATPLRDVIRFLTRLRGRRGLAVGHVAQTLVFDSTPPEILNISVQGKNLRPGGMLLLGIHARDLGVGMGPTVYTRVVATRPLGAPCEREALLKSTLVSKGNDRFEVRRPLPTNLCRGDFAVATVFVYDLVGNRGQARAPLDRAGLISVGGVYEGLTGSVSRIATFVVSEEAPAGDVGAPKITGLAASARMRAGEMGEIRFEATDESGIQLDSAFWGEWAPTFETGVPIRSPIRGRARRLTGNTYGLAFRANPHLPPGEYFLRRFFVTDASANRNIARLQSALPKAGGLYPATALTVPKLIVEAGVEGVDLDPPLVSELRLSNVPVLPGQTALVWLRATDNVSGIADNDKTIGLLSPTFSRTYYVPRLLVRGPLRRNSDGTFLALIDVPLDAEPGSYFLTYFQIEDRAELARAYRVVNPAQVRIAPHDPHFYEGLASGPPLRVQFLNVGATHQLEPSRAP